MSSDDARPAFDEASDREYERKMIQSEGGPTTTYFEQLMTDRGQAEVRLWWA